MTIFINFSLRKVHGKGTQDSGEIGVASLVETCNWKLEGVGLNQFRECLNQLIQRARLINSSPAQVFGKFSRIFDVVFGACLQGDRNPQLSSRTSSGPAALKRCTEKRGTNGVLKNLKIFVTPRRMPGGSSYERLRSLRLAGREAHHITGGADQQRR